MLKSQLSGAYARVCVAILDCFSPLKPRSPNALVTLTQSTNAAGGILFLIGSFIYLVSQSLLMITALIVASVTSLMPEMSLRQRAWHSIASQFMFLLGMSFFVVGAACYVTQSLGLLASLLWLVASTMWIVAFFVRLRGTWLYFVPLMAFGEW